MKNIKKHTMKKLFYEVALKNFENILFTWNFE